MNRLASIYHIYVLSSRLCRKGPKDKKGKVLRSPSDGADNPKPNAGVPVVG